MSSKMGNQEASESAAEERAQEQVTDRDEETPDANDVRVTDKRRFTVHGESAAGDEDQEPERPHHNPANDPGEIASEIEQLQSKLKEVDEKRIEAERQVREFNDRFRQAQAQLKAETEEQRMRMQRSFDQKLEATRGDLVAGLLDTLDNLKRAVASVEKSDKRETDFDALLEGVRATANMFEAKMKSLGLTSVPSVGEEFNPMIHEAVEIVAVPASQDNQVVEEFQTGYKFGDRLLRPARVRVGRAGN